MLSPSHNILPCDGAACYLPEFIGTPTAESLLDELLETIPWQAERIVMFGKPHMVPRLVCWFGDCAYTYSGVRHEPTPWPPVLLSLKAQVEQASNARFNSVLANLYRDGRDGMGWHSDDEPTMGQGAGENTIASLSLGAARNFRLRHKQRRVSAVGIVLTPGSLLVMDAAVQSNWQHALMKTARPVGPRLNLTFRWISS